MMIGRRAALTGIATAALGSVVRARDAALNPGLCGAPDVKGFAPYCFTDSAGRRHQVYLTGGGGISNLAIHGAAPHLELTNTTLSNNEAAFGGGLLNRGRASLVPALRGRRSHRHGAPAQSTGRQRRAH